LHKLFQENLLPLFKESNNNTMGYRGQRWWWCVLLWVSSGGGSGGGDVVLAAAADNGPQQQQRQQLGPPLPFSRDGTLRFSEIMIYPLSASLNTTRWFELYNTGNNTVALDGLQFTTSSDSSFKLQTSDSQHNQIHCSF
jgi:hypothetical protein